MVREKFTSGNVAFAACRTLSCSRLDVFLTSSGPGRTWVLAPIASRPVRISFLVFGTHLPSVFFVSLEPYGAIGQISQLLLVHVSEELCIRYRKGAGIAWLVAAGRCATTMKGL